MSSSYRKAIKGDGNEAYEEFSHNRVTINFNGAGVVMFVAFLIVLLGAAIIWLVVNFGNLLALSLLALWIVAVLGAIWLGTVFVVSRTGILLSERRRARHHERLITSGEVSFYLQPLAPDFNIYAAAAEYARAGVAQPNTIEIEAEPTATDETVLTLWRKGLSLRDIEKATGRKYHEIQKLTSDEKKKFDAPQPK